MPQEKKELEIQMLGNVTVRYGGQPIHIRGGGV